MAEDHKDVDHNAEEADNTASEHKQQIKNTVDEFKKDLNSMQGENKKILAGILAILFGGFGIHKFVLGYHKEGFTLLAVTLVLGIVSCGIGASLTGLIGLIEGIIYLTKSDEAFYNTYQLDKKPWF